MKKLIVLLVILSGFSITYAQFNSAVSSNNVNLSTYVIAPFQVWDATPSSTPSLPDVIKGQTRTLVGEERFVKLFEMTRDPNRFVYLDLDCPPTVGGLTISAGWYFYDEPPPQWWDFTGYAITGQNFIWDVIGKTSGYIALKITQLNATNPACNVGTKTFTATVRGWYYNI